MCQPYPLIEHKSRMFPPSLTTIDKGHGRIERRTIQVLHTPSGLGFPYLEQVARIEREIERRESVIVSRRRVATWRTTQETVYVITSLYPEEAGPEDLLAITRGHWTVEALHWIRDVTCGPPCRRCPCG